MRNTKSRGVLERGAVSDLWRNSLAQIPCTFGRLVYLAALRNPNSGHYEHHGLALRFGEHEADRALRSGHARVFSEWLSYTLEQQKADLDLYLAGMMDSKRTILDTWLRLSPYRNLIPASIQGVEKRLYLSDFETLMELLKNEYGVSSPDPDA